jgi:hypothetical protein
MKREHFVLLVLGILLALDAQSSTLRAQGNLIPPDAPGPTMKTLDQIEPRTPISSLPYTISSPGAYYVTTNLTGVSAASGISIAASYVSLDFYVGPASTNNIITRNVAVTNTVQTISYNVDTAHNDVGPIGRAATATSPWANLQY